MLRSHMNIHLPSDQLLTEAAQPGICWPSRSGNAFLLFVHPTVPVSQTFPTVIWLVVTGICYDFFHTQMIHGAGIFGYIETS